MSAITAAPDPAVIAVIPANTEAKSPICTPSDLEVSLFGMFCSGLFVSGFCPSDSVVSFVQCAYNVLSSLDFKLSTLLPPSFASNQPSNK